jgi:hypothetical protein
MVIPSSPQLAQDVEDLAHKFGVEGGGDLIEQHDFRRHGQRADDRDALLLPARELVGIVLHPVGKAEALEECGDRFGQLICGFFQARGGGRA